MKIKSKISIGLAIQFILILAISAMSLIYIHKISVEAEGIIKDNYKSLDYITGMSNSLVSIQRSDKDGADYNNAINSFNFYLKAQENNITEQGERSLVINVKKNFELLKKRLNISSSDLLNIQHYLNRIHKLNMKAIISKNNQAQITSNKVTTIMSAITALSLVIMIMFYVYFPNYISFAFMTISERMREIAAGRYEQRLNLKSGDEFEDISRSFDIMVEKLQAHKK